MGTLADTKPTESHYHQELLDAYLQCIDENMSDEQRQLIWRILTGLYDSRQLYERLVEWTIKEFGKTEK
jgi:hypothetical protein